MAKKLFGALFLAGLVAVGWWIYQDTWGYQATLKRLLATGFQADDIILPGRPRVVFATAQRRLAFVYPGRYTVIDYSQLLRWEWEVSQRQGWSNKSAQPDSYFVIFYTRHPQAQAVKVEGLPTDEYQIWRERLRMLLANSTGNR